MYSASPVLCDVSVANVDGVWKSRVLGDLLKMDVRAGRLARLVKLWAKWQGINDPTAGTFNSYSLLLMVGSGGWWVVMGSSSGCMMKQIQEGGDQRTCYVHMPMVLLACVVYSVFGIHNIWHTQAV